MEIKLKEVSTAALAYLGDSVMELCVRKMLVERGFSSSKRLNAKALEYVTAKKQSLVCDILLEHLTEKEADIFRWAKNAKGGPGPRSVTVYEYRKATGLEAVFGYNRLVGNEQRNRELFDIIYPIDVQ